MISEKKEKKKKNEILLTKKPHVFVFHSSTYIVTNKLFQKEKKRPTLAGISIPVCSIDL